MCPPSPLPLLASASDQRLAGSCRLLQGLAACVTVGVSRDNGWAWWFSFAFAGGLKNSTRNLSISFSKHERLLPLLTLSHRLSEETRSFYSCLVVLCFPGTLRHPCLHFARVRSFHFVLLFRHFHYEKYVERVE